jgi:hypothetical protein
MSRLDASKPWILVILCLLASLALIFKWKDQPTDPTIRLFCIRIHFHLVWYP